MKRTCLSLLLVLAWPGVADADEVNLCLAKSGGMATALASVANMNFSAQKACDGQADTGWVAEKGALPVWLRVEWRVPVEIREVVVRLFPKCPFKEVGPVGEYVIEVLGEGMWRAAAGGNAAQMPVSQEIRHTLKSPVRTTAVRLVVKSAPTGQVAVSELEALGPEVALPVEWTQRWQGVWIWCEPSLHIPHREPVRRYMRRSFDLDDPGQVREAWLLACAFDRLNGMWVNSRPALSHGSLCGGSLRRAQVRQIPVEWLVKGENVLAAEVDDLYEVGSHGLLAELVLARKDGTRTVIATDEKWQGQEDQGKVMDWRKPGLTDDRWVACRTVRSPNNRWHWLWNVARPTVAPEDQLKVVELEVSPRLDASLRVESLRPVKPGGAVNVSVAFECAKPLRADYAIVLRLGQPSYCRNHDFELGGAFLRPEEVKTTGWQPGRHEVSVRAPVPEYAPSDTPATLLVSTPSAAAGLQTAVPGTMADEYGLHFTIKVDRGHAPMPTARDFPRCEIRTVAGNPTLHIDGTPVPPILWSSHYGNYQRYSEYAATGVKLFRPFIEGSPICAPGEDASFYPWWFEQVDRMLSAAVSVDPEVKLLPGVTMDPNPQWLFDEPSEQMMGGRGHLVIPLAYFVPDRGQVRPTFMSQAWRRDGAEALKRLVRHIRAQPYAPNVIGICLLAGRAGENYWGGNERNIFMNERGGYDAKPREQWEAGDFSMAARRTFRDFLIAKYGADKALQRAWQRPGIRFDDILEPARFDREEACNALVWANKPEGVGSLRDPLQPGAGTLPMDYYQCMAEAMLDTFAAWGRAVKEASDGRLITGCYYGYALAQLFTAVPGFHAHTAVAKASRTPHLDFYVSPSEYDHSRRAGGHYWGHNIVDSLRLHNKLWIYEADTRTYLADILPKTFSQRETLDVLKRDAAAALTRGVGWWWYEFAEGQTGSRAREWFSDPAIADFAAHIKKVYDYALTLPDRGPSAQIAVFFHGESTTAQDIFPPTLQVNIAIGRHTLIDGMPRVGAPFDLYNLADIPHLAETGLLKQYRMCLFLNPFYLTAEERGWLDLCKGGGRTLVWLWAPGLAQAGEHPSPDHVSEVTGIAGVKWLQRKAVQSYRLAATDHPIVAGLPTDRDFTPQPFPRGSTWERYGNEVWPVIYVDPPAAGGGTQVLGHWVLDGQVREDMAALCVRPVSRLGWRRWTSVYAAVPYLTPEVMRNIARFAGVHIYRDANDVLFASRHFLAIHTGSATATGDLRLPGKTGVCDVFSGEVIAKAADMIQVNVEPFATRLYHLGAPHKFRAALGR